MCKLHDEFQPTDALLKLFPNTMTKDTFLVCTDYIPDRNIAKFDYQFGPKAESTFLWIEFAPCKMPEAPPYVAPIQFKNLFDDGYIREKFTPRKEVTKITSMVKEENKSGCTCSNAQIFSGGCICGHQKRYEQKW